METPIPNQTNQPPANPKEPVWMARERKWGWRKDTPKKPEKNLYDILEVDGRFAAILPGLVELEHGYIVGTTTKEFSSRQEAEVAVAQSREREQNNIEQRSLEKTFPHGLFRFENLPNGQIRLTTPGLYHEKTKIGYESTSRVYATWNEAKAAFLEYKQNEERLHTKPLLKLEIGQNERIAFSSLEAFDPRVSPSKTAHPIPESIKGYLFSDGRLDGSRGSAGTYQETIKQPDWELKLFNVVKGYLQKPGGDGERLLQQLGIKDIKALTPKQAAELSTQIVIDLSKYRDKDTEEPSGGLAGLSLAQIAEMKTEADQRPAWSLLEEGMRKKGDADWEGNGICRNFASTVKAVFEALKAQQTLFNQLHDTYCTYEGGSAFDPSHQAANMSVMGKDGHAWNTFVTISREGAANATIIDATWASRNLETQQVEGVDYTLMRMEPVVNAVAKQIKQQELKDHPEQLDKMLGYYMSMIDSCPESKKGQKKFFVTRTVELMKHQGVPAEIPPKLAPILKEVYLDLAESLDPTELEVLYQVSRRDRTMDFNRVFRKYAREKPISKYWERAYIFTDNELQFTVYSILQLDGRMEQFLKESPVFRIRMREVLPDLFIGFEPVEKKEDLDELKTLLQNSNSLRHLLRALEVGTLTTERMNKFFATARQTLRQINPTKYDQLSAGLNDYQIIKQSNSLSTALRAKDES